MFKFSLSNSQGETLNQWQFRAGEKSMIVIGRNPTCEISLKHYSISSQQMLIHLLPKGRLSVVHLSNSSSTFIDSQTDPIIRNQIVLVKNKAKFRFPETDFILHFAFYPQRQLDLENAQIKKIAKKRTTTYKTRRDKTRGIKKKKVKCLQVTSSSQKQSATEPQSSLNLTIAASSRNEIE